MEGDKNDTFDKVHTNSLSMGTCAAIVSSIIFYVLDFIRLTKDVKILYIYFIHNLIFVSLF